MILDPIPSNPNPTPKPPFSFPVSLAAAPAAQTPPRDPGGSNPVPKPLVLNIALSRALSAIFFTSCLCFMFCLCFVFVSFIFDVRVSLLADDAADL